MVGGLLVQEITGYLKLSISIAGPHDKLTMHDYCDGEDDTTRQREHDQLGKLLIPPNIRR